MADTDRAVTVPLTYALVLGVVTLLAAGLFVSASGYVDGQREQAVRSELRVAGQRLAADLAAVDRLATRTNGSVRAAVDLPERVAGSGYLVTVERAAAPDTYRLTLRSVAAEVEVTVTVVTATPVRTGQVDGGDLVVTYDPADGRLEVADG